MTHTPIGKRILFTPHSPESVLESTNKALCETGTVVAVGPDVVYIQPGDVITFSLYGVDTVTIDDQSYHFILEDDRFLLSTVHE